PTMNATTPKTPTFAASTRPRCGTAANVARTIPDEYSPVTTATPSAPINNWARTAPPPKALLTICAAVATGLCDRYPTPTPTPTLTMPSTTHTNSHQVERTLRSLIHSIRATCRNPYRPGAVPSP